LFGFVKFTAPRLWRGSCLDKFIVILNYSTLVAVKVVQVSTPLILKYVVDAITCEELDTGEERVFEICPAEDEVYVLIIAYCLSKFFSEVLNNVRELPYARMAARAETMIAEEVYDHI